MKMTMLFLFMAMLASVGMPLIGYAADATSFNPLAVSVQAQAISGVPVGTIITWPVAGNPEGWAEGNWLECNGQTISPTVYPELCALIGGQVPDIRGLFLRGVGGNAGALGVLQDQSTSTISLQMDTVIGLWQFGDYVAVGHPGQTITGWGGNNTAGLKLTMSTQPSENRPINQAVRYLIRAKP